MAVTAVLTHRTEGLPEPKVRYAWVGKSGVRGPQRSTAEVSCVNRGHGE